MILHSITSTSNPHLKEIAKVRKNPVQELFFVEGTRFVEELPPQCISEVFTTQPEKHAEFLKTLPPNVPVYHLSEPAMGKICAAASDQTIACTLHRENTPRPQKLILLDEVQDPGNVGTIIRTAYAFGFGVILSPGCANPWSSKALMATAGAFRTCYIEQCNDLEANISALKKDGFSIFATALDSSAIPPEAVSPGEKSAIIIGNEGKGISPRILAAADQTVYIPMCNPINSLNAASAASIMLYMLR